MLSARQSKVDERMRMVQIWMERQAGTEKQILRIVARAKVEECQKPWGGHTESTMTE